MRRLLEAEQAYMYSNGSVPRESKALHLFISLILEIFCKLLLNSPVNTEINQVFRMLSESPRFVHSCASHVSIPLKSTLKDRSEIHDKGTPSLLDNALIQIVHILKRDRIPRPNILKTLGFLDGGDSAKPDLCKRDVFTRPKMSRHLASARPPC